MIFHSVKWYSFKVAEFCSSFHFVLLIIQSYLTTIIALAPWVEQHPRSNGKESV